MEVWTRDPRLVHSEYQSHQIVCIVLHFISTSLTKMHNCVHRIAFYQYQFHQSAQLSASHWILPVPISPKCTIVCIVLHFTNTSFTKVHNCVHGIGFYQYQSHQNAQLSASYCILPVPASPQCTNVLHFDHGVGFIMILYCILTTVQVAS